MAKRKHIENIMERREKEKAERYQGQNMSFKDTPQTLNCCFQGGFGSSLPPTNGTFDFEFINKWFIDDGTVLMIQLPHIVKH